MRILLVSPYPPQKDGIGDYSSKLRAGLADRGHEVAVLTPRRIAGAPAEVIGSLATDELAAVVGGFAADVVHVQFAVAAFGTRTPGLVRALGQLDVPVVTTLHEVTRDTDALRSAGRALYRALARRSTSLIAHTAPARRALTDRVGAAGRPVHVIPHHRAEPPAATVGANELRRRYELDGCRVLLAFGFIHVDKGLDDLVHAVALLRGGDPRWADLRLAVAGEVRTRSGAFRAFEARDRLHLRRIHRDARRFGVHDAIVESGYVPAGEVRPWFDVAEAVVLPYKAIEQSGVASMAAAVGAPMLTSTTGTLAAEFGDPRWPLPAGDPVGIATAIGGFLDAGGRDTAFRRAPDGDDAQSICHEIEAVYRSALGSAAGVTHAA